MAKSNPNNRTQILTVTAGAGTNAEKLRERSRDAWRFNNEVEMMGDRVFMGKLTKLEFETWRVAAIKKRRENRRLRGAV